VFQSTPPAWGATCHVPLAGSTSDCFNPRPPRGGDQSELNPETPDIVSIHAPRVGGDSLRKWPSCAYQCFNPRPPRGGRRSSPCIPIACMSFQSTPPAWGATHLAAYLQRRQICFNPRPPRGGRRKAVTAEAPVIGFNPRPPRGGRRSFFLERMEGV